MTEVGLEGSGDEGRRQAERCDVSIEGCPYVVEEDVTDGGGHSDEHQGQGSEGRRRGGDFGVPQQQGAVGLLLVVEADVDTTGLVGRHELGEVRGFWVQQLTMAVDPGVLIAQQMPLAILQRPQSRERIVGRARVDLDAAYVVALELFAQAVRVDVQDALAEQRRVGRVQRGDAVEQVGPGVQRIGRDVGHGSSSR